VTTDETPERFIRRFLDTYEEHDLDRLWTFYSADCRFPVLERFNIEPDGVPWGGVTRGSGSSVAVSVADESGPPRKAL